MSDTDVLVIGEHHNGRIRSISFELVTAARGIADEIGGNVSVAVLGADVDAFARELASIEGVDRVVAVSHDALVPFTAGPWTASVAQLARQVSPFALLIPSSITGRDYAARVAARLDAALVPDAIALSVDEGHLAASRAVLGARVVTAVRFEGDAPAIVTVAPGSFPKAGVGDGAAPIDALAVEITDADRRVSLEGTFAHQAGARALAGAERIVSGGRGLGKAENFALVEELAAVLGAAVGASGATVGAGWRSHDDQVGSTGHIVSPRLYLAVGISGAPQHLVGMQGSEYVVAINRDPDAPIFNVASFGIVGDLFEVVPALIAELKATADHGAS
jgi:electron transfer flavoprotein alpha subunit